MRAGQQKRIAQINRQASAVSLARRSAAALAFFIAKRQVGMSEEITAAHAANAQTTDTGAATEQQQITEQTANAETQGQAGATETPETSSDDGGAHTETEGEERKRNNVPARERIQQLASRARQAEAERDQLLAQLQALRPQAQGQSIDPLNYASDLDYQAALIEATVAKSVNAARADIVRQQAEAAEYQRQQAQAAAWHENVQSFAASVPDFEVVAMSQAVPVSETMAHAIQMAEAGPQVAYYLGKNLDVAREIHSLPPLQQAIRIGQLAERLGASPARKSTTAPRPPATITGGGQVSSPDPSKMSMDDYVKWRAKGR